MAIFNPGPSLTVANNLVQQQYDCDISAAKGDVVRHSTTVDNKIISLTSNIYDNLAIGIIIEKPSDTTCLVRWSGTVTTATGLIRGKPVFIGTDGTPTTTVPTTGHMQFIGTAATATEFLVDIGSQKVIRELT